MKTTLLLRDIYFEAFRELGNFVVQNYFKAFAWFSAAMFATVVYAFVYRVATGFAFV
jgi:hypothetical protein